MWFINQFMTRGPHIVPEFPVILRLGISTISAASQREISSPNSSPVWNTKYDIDNHMNRIWIAYEKHMKSI